METFYLLFRELITYCALTKTYQIVHLRSTGVGVA